MAKLQLEVFNYTKYGDAACSKCGKALRRCYVVARVDDDGGYEWGTVNQRGGN